MITTTIQAPSWNFVTARVRRTIPVTTAPTPLTHTRQRQPFSRSRSQRRTMPPCESVNEMNTPMAYRGRRAWVSPLKPTIRRMANPLRIRIPLEKTRRSPWVANCLGLNGVIRQAGAEHPAGDLRHDRLVATGDDPEVVGEVGDPEEHRDGDDAQPGHDGLGVPSLGRLERRHAVGDSLDAGERGAAGGVGSQDEEQ